MAEWSASPSPWVVTSALREFCLRNSFDRSTATGMRRIMKMYRESFSKTWNKYQ
jgi:hypothetical protein